MEKITFTEFPELRLETYTKEAQSYPSGEEITAFSVTALAQHPLLIKTADEVPFFFYDQKAHLIGGAPLSKEGTLKEELKKRMVRGYRASEVCILCTGSQGEAMDRSVFLP